MILNTGSGDHKDKGVHCIHLMQSSSHARRSPGAQRVQCCLQQLQPIAAERLLLLMGWRAFCKSWAWQHTQMPSIRCIKQMSVTSELGQ